MKQTHTPTNLDLKKDHALTIEWDDGNTSVYPIAYLRKMSPSADMRELRKSMANNPLTILPDSMGSSGTITATGAEMVGNYAIKIAFSDGHDTGIYTWDYLREIDPANQTGGLTKSDQGPSHSNPLGLPGR
ncbi:hypothetical protein COB72_10005 [bacterium]|nr:MAG: hypothetical protein COB72_10005 [bacterium]